jgi:hypothetical protein
MVAGRKDYLLLLNENRRWNGDFPSTEEWGLPRRLEEGLD